MHGAIIHTIAIVGYNISHYIDVNIYNGIMMQVFMFQCACCKVLDSIDVFIRTLPH